MRAEGGGGGGGEGRGERKKDAWTPEGCKASYPGSTLPSAGPASHPRPSTNKGAVIPSSERLRKSLSKEQRELPGPLLHTRGGQAGPQSLAADRGLLIPQFSHYQPTQQPLDLHHPNKHRAQFMCLIVNTGCKCHGSHGLIQKENKCNHAINH